jgi:hypothetical protein
VAKTWFASVEAELKTYASDVTAKFALLIDFNPEDQLKTTIDACLNKSGPGIVSFASPACVLMS